MFQILKRYRNPIASAAILGIIVTACVTVNVNFPESAVQQATDDFVRDLYRAKKKPEAPSTTFHFSLFPSAVAAEAEFAFKVRTEKTLAIQSRLQDRVKEIIQFKKSGVLGEDSKGLLAIKGADRLKKLEAKRVESLVESENRDREILYLAVLEGNQMSNDRLPAIRKSFSRSFQAESPSGTWLESDEGQWSQKP